QNNQKVSPKLVTLYRELGLTKVPQTVNFVKDLLDPDLQVVVFAHHREVVNGVNDALSGYPTFAILGDTDPKQRQAAVNGFQSGKLRCLVLSILAASVGITLTAARIAVFAELFWTGNSLEQAQARIRRIGQKNFCTYYFLQYPNSIDQTIYGSVRSKERVV